MSLSQGTDAPPLLDVVTVARDYRLPRRALLVAPVHRRVLHGVSLRIEAGVSVGLIGESGGGKSTLARIVMALERPDFGTVRVNGEDLFRASRRRRREIRQRMQMVFQDPYGSLDPRHAVGRIVAEPLIGLNRGTSRGERRERVAAGLAAVGLSAEDAARYPHEFSGGQRQRIAIARSLITDPDLLVADEPVSALDVSVRAQILNLMLDLRDRRGLTYLLISHDLTVVRHVTGRVVVLYLGRVVEEGPTDQVMMRPLHPYSAALVAAAPRPDPNRRRQPRPVVADPPVNPAVRHCPYAALCPRARDKCRAEMPPLELADPGHSVACFYPLA